MLNEARDDSGTQGMLGGTTRLGHNICEMSVYVFKSALDSLSHYSPSAFTYCVCITRDWYYY